VRTNLAIYEFLRCWAEDRRILIDRDDVQYPYWNPRGENDDWHTHAEKEAQGWAHIAEIVFPRSASLSSARNLARFAHELGHHVAWTRDRACWSRELWNKVNDPERPPLTAEQAAQVLAVERCAWTEGRRLLAEAGAKKFRAFNAARRQGLRSYQARLATRVDHRSRRRDHAAAAVPVGSPR
jgi:hypothetical protein